ncbi:heterokaryon incompatibility protein-domain-containing protein [Apiosordaria backusii]|uniref:Heterokaryon incompatibility protein-domain-containing protein n=1 Tax=Apiosordaria backusii TaxID=314023 RepID=A0AA40DQF0_9PEZI|nr:heterokaryon incompatibility protein-domain-containing protein [Apiosordaria backusii]
MAASKHGEKWGNVYSYTSLSKSTCIRLLSIKPGTLTTDRNQPIQLCMREVDLDDNPVYEALSYTWGEPLTVFPTLQAKLDALSPSSNDPLPVICEGRILHVTYNLYMYLLTWRHIQSLMADKEVMEKMGSEVAASSLKLPTEMWTDAVCINQADIDEKSAQVAMMGRIYSSCQKVTIWLGPQDEFSRIALRILQRLSKISQLQARAFGKMNDKAVCQLLGLPDTTSSVWWSVFALLHRAWFRRVWVVQEVALAPDAQVQCGLMSTSWELIANACMVLLESGLGATIDSLAWFEIDGPKVDEPLFDDELNPIMRYSKRDDNTRNLFTTLDRNSVQGCYWSAYLLHLTRSGGAEDVDVEDLLFAPGSDLKKKIEHIPLMHVLENFRPFDATNSRDKIYAFLDIAQRRVYQPYGDDVKYIKEIKPNYRMPCEELYLDAAWSIVLGGAGSLEILCRQHIWKDSAKDDEEHLRLPSWVPDWSRQVTMRGMVGMYNPRWKACRELKWSVPDDGERTYQQFLPVQGVLIDTVLDVVDVLPSDEQVTIWAKSGDIAARLPKEYPWVSAVGLERGEGGQTPGEVLWRTLVADTIENQTPASGKRYHRFFWRKWMGQLKEALRLHHTDFSDLQREKDWTRFFMNMDNFFPVYSDEEPLAWEVESEAEEEEDMFPVINEINAHQEFAPIDTVDVKESVFDKMTRDLRKSLYNEDNRQENDEARQDIAETAILETASASTLADGKQPPGPNTAKKGRKTYQDQKLAMFRERHGRASYGRAIFRTESQYLGNGPTAAIQGDQVWIVAGADAPLILRPDGDRFKIVGDAYVHGIMFGEGLKKGELREIELA